MSMQTLNQLVARSIIDPSIVQSFAAGQIDDVIAELDFSPDLQSRLGDLEVGSWTEFALLAYRVVKAAEEPIRRIELPSPMEGLVQEEKRADKGQVA